MNIIYTYRAALYCRDCATEICEDLECPGNPDDPHTYDSNDYPKSAPNGESDNPEHCAGCRKFLKNPLTDDGREYVRRQARENPTEIVETWCDYYGIAISPQEATDVEHRDGEFLFPSADRPIDDRTGCDTRTRIYRQDNRFFVVYVGKRPHLPAAGVDEYIVEGSGRVIPHLFTFWQGYEVGEEFDCDRPEHRNVLDRYLQITI